MRRIKDKMMVSVLSVLAILLVALTTIIGIYIFISEKNDLLNRNLLIARNYAGQVDSFISRYNAIAQTLSDSQENFNSRSRPEVQDFLKQVADKDKNILGSWVIYEPNAFDGLDTEFRNKIGHDSTGRFLPYWNRLKGNLILEPVTDVDVSDFYTVPKKTKDVFIPTPFIYDGVLMMSFCYPILKNGIFKGAAGLDISIETLKSLLEGFEESKKYKSNYAILVTNTGTLISTSNHLFDNYIIEKKTLSQIGESLKTPEYENLAKLIVNGKEDLLEARDPFTKEEVITFFSPTKIGNLSIIVSISKVDLRANTIRAIYILVAIGFISLMIIGAILYYLINSVIDPLNRLTDAVVAFGKQDFSQRSEVVTNDEIGELSKNFNAMANSIEEYSIQMEEKVKQRTIELNESLEKVTELKFQQDGDYFLTSILLNPFYKNESRSQKFKVDFLIEQKKKFEFKKRKLSLGGDLCYTEIIELRGKSFIVFLNGDAMGKSLQGAGGALILGSVFSSILARCKSNSESQNVSPERWLKNVFKELHQAFETFDGLMLVSIVLGLIEEQTGVMYYINAEHPFIVLYRDECASFIEESVDLRKLGTPMTEGKLFIKVCQLKPNDIILIGSDGKDDLVISERQNENREINFDETLFLRVVEECKGDMRDMKQKLLNYGELMDDLSILRIEFINDIPKLEKGNINKQIVSTLEEAIIRLESMVDTNHFALKQLSKLYIKKGNFEYAYLRIKKYLEIVSSDTEAFYLGSYCSLKLKYYQAAIEFGERSILREPNNARYLKLLSKVYTVSGMKEKSESLKRRLLK